MSQIQLTTFETLDLFLRRARELQQTRLITSGYSPKISMQISSQEGIKVTSNDPDEEDLRSFLLTLRQFVSKKEPIHLHRIHSLLYKHLTSEELTTHLVEARKALTFVEQGGGIEVKFNDTDVTPERLADLWINGVYFHNDQEKLQALNLLLPHPGLMPRYRFVMFMLDVTHHIFYIGSLINHALKEGLIRED